MLLVFDWLLDFIDIKETPAEISDLLTMAGLEIESMEEGPHGVVLDVNVTPNRPDCLSVTGLARELSAILGRPLRELDAVMLSDTGPCGFNVEINSPTLCARYTGRAIKGVKVAPSPEWLRRWLEGSGVRAINNVVDATNYVMLEMGQPLHSFDSSRLNGCTIKVESANSPTKFTTLDGVEREVAAGTLLIWDAERPIAVAGVMGGQNTEVTDSTTEIFLESACFSPASVRRTSKALNLRSESSYRFERGVDVQGCADALDRAAYLLVKLCGAHTSEIVDVYPVPFKATEVRVNIDRLNGLLGLDIPRSDIEAILIRLNFQFDSSADSTGDFIIKPPSYRQDITQRADVAEEVARIYGYDKIPETMPRVSITARYATAGNAMQGRYAMNVKPTIERVAEVKTMMRHAGFTETINYSFMSEAAFQLLGIQPEDPRRKTIRLKNPIKSEQSLMRSFLAPSSIDNLLYNVNLGTTDVRIYEIAVVFLNPGGNNGVNLPEERLKLSALIYEGETLWKETAGLFFKAKGLVESIFELLHIKSYEYSPSREPFLMAGQALDVSVVESREICGYVGLLSPEVINRLELKSVKGEIAIVELFLDSIFKAGSSAQSRMPLPKYPSIKRDISMLIDNDYPAADVLRLIKSYPDPLVESVDVFDYYKGKNIPDGKKSLAYRIVYRAQDRTLTNSEIDSLHEAIIAYLVKETGCSLRS